MDRTEAMICQHLDWPGIRNSVWKIVTNCDTYQHTKLSNKKYGKLTAKEAEKIPWNKLCVDIIGPYAIRRKGRKETLHLKAITMINPVRGLFEITKYNYKRAISVANLVETMWLSRYPIPMEITYDQGSWFISHEFRKSLIERWYRITSKPITSVNSTFNDILECIHKKFGKPRAGF